jgi:ABC-2 type transport system permease protein
VSHALVYLELQSRKNALLGWLRRLREPRYALGSIAVAAYLGYFVLRPIYRDGEASRAASAMFGSFLTGDFAPLALFLLIAWGWFFGAERAALPFSQAEVAFLFPAPVKRRTLLHYRLLKAQVAIVFGAALYPVVLWVAEAPYWQRCVGFWAVLTFHNLHGVARAFTRERLLALGVTAQRRRVALGALLLGAIAISAYQASTRSAPLIPAAQAGFEATSSALLGAPPLSWILAPFRLAIAPLRAASSAELLWALAPALALLAAHYAWVLRTLVGFEEGSLALAEKNAAVMSAMRSGRNAWSALRKRSAGSDPFALSPRGRPEIAFLWQRMIAAGSWASPRSLLVLSAVPIALAAALLGAPAAAGTLRFGGIAALTLAVNGLMLGPPMFRGAVGQLFEQMDLAKSYPLRGWQIVAGELWGPSALLALFEATLITVAAIASGTLGESVTPAFALAGWFAAVANVPLLGALLFGVQLGVQLALPAWFRAEPSQARLEVGGQRLLFMFAGLIASIVACAPAGLAGGVAGGVAYAIAGAAPLAIASAGGAAALALAAELALLVLWLGRRFERIDLASDLPR